MTLQESTFSTHVYRTLFTTLKIFALGLTITRNHSLDLLGCSKKCPQCRSRVAIAASLTVVVARGNLCRLVGLCDLLADRVDPKISNTGYIQQTVEDLMINKYE